jgi:hypothetical protein
MKARIIKPALFVLLGIFLGMYFLRCGNDVGIGSDFDATKYYTKEEVDSLISKNKSSIIMGSRAMGPNETAYTMFNFNGNENQCQIVAPVNGVLRNLFVQSNSGSGTPSSNVEITVRVNGSDTSLALNYPIADAGTIKSNTNDAVAVSQGDYVSIKLRETGGATSGPIYVTFLFDAAV